MDIIRELGQQPQIPNSLQSFGHVRSLHMVLVGTLADNARSSAKLPHGRFFKWRSWYRARQHYPQSAFRWDFNDIPTKSILVHFQWYTYKPLSSAFSIMYLFGVNSMIYLQDIFRCDFNNIFSSEILMIYLQSAFWCVFDDIPTICILVQIQWYTYKLLFGEISMITYKAFFGAFSMIYPQSTFECNSNDIPTKHK